MSNWYTIIESAPVCTIREFAERVSLAVGASQHAAFLDLGAREPRQVSLPVSRPLP